MLARGLHSPRLGGALLAAALAAGCGDPALQTESPPDQASPAGRTVIWECGMVAGALPRAITVACGDGNMVLRELRWRNWGYQNATATGLAAANSCMPDCASGHWLRFPVRVIASQLVLGDRFAAYGALTIDAVGKPPAGLPAHQVVPLTTSGPGGRS
jgi:hypothetical protein